MTDRGRLVVHRRAASGRYRRGSYGVFVDGTRSGSLRDGQLIDIDLDVGPHDLQVGTMTYPYSGTPRLLGSPVLTVEIRAGRTCRVVATPAEASLLRQTGSPESVLVLTTDDEDQPVRSTSVRMAADRARPADRGRNFLTAGMIDAKRPWRTWQGILTTACFVFCLWVVVVSLFFTHSGGSGRWVLAVVFALVGALFGAQLVVAARARRDARRAGQSE
ncbi:MAG TPA: hypothetical protein VFU35_05490 [Jatrophihabitans sp.]|nr:hypothetical protein [Jatrophihabitans sp.]